jgi:hypothetical protein
MVRNVARCSLVHASITSAHDLVLADAELIVRGTRDGVGAGIPPSRGLRCSLLVFLRLMRFWEIARIAWVPKWSRIETWPPAFFIFRTCSEARYLRFTADRRSDRVKPLPKAPVKKFYFFFRWGQGGVVSELFI